MLMGSRLPTNRPRSLFMVITSTSAFGRDFCLADVRVADDPGVCNLNMREARKQVHSQLRGLDDYQGALILNAQLLMGATMPRQDRPQVLKEPAEAPSFEFLDPTGSRRSHFGERQVPFTNSDSSRTANLDLLFVRQHCNRWRLKG